ncbi:hypothetical protein BU24DRAFT_415659 [Aaosphaeria arxii CBS 175.79]|uniref:Uncharacterized protein n=1 Tax=Aaosphaeria arxii CBS 175.79 TaxID=1450172 RepID=A0A6A5X6K9_9PLEO|nr:uncharacterized protein BU24DRAFT_415659 [Aaosphaeria arxii CBS 175.79]KAF2008603.1 hypothetical protein BU24DRAFT_415659 [Aaosphaeria arxii CBS 175.79]
MFLSHAHRVSLASRLQFSNMPGPIWNQTPAHWGNIDENGESILEEYILGYPSKQEQENRRRRPASTTEPVGCRGCHKIFRTQRELAKHFRSTLCGHYRSANISSTPRGSKTISHQSDHQKPVFDWQCRRCGSRLHSHSAALHHIAQKCRKSCNECKASGRADSCRARSKSGPCDRCVRYRIECSKQTAPVESSSPVMARQPSTISRSSEAKTSKKRKAVDQPQLGRNQQESKRIRESISSGESSRKAATLPQAPNSTVPQKPRIVDQAGLLENMGPSRRVEPEHYNRQVQAHDSTPPSFYLNPVHKEPPSASTPVTNSSVHKTPIEANIMSPYGAIPDKFKMPSTMNTPEPSPNQYAFPGPSTALPVIYFPVYPWHVAPQQPPVQDRQDSSVQTSGEKGADTSVNGAANMPHELRNEHSIDHSEFPDFTPEDLGIEHLFSGQP